MQRAQAPRSGRPPSSPAATPANALRAPEAFARTATNTCMKSKVTWTQTCFLHSARGSSDRGANSERLLQRRQDARPTPEKMAWIHAFVLETPVSSPQGCLEDALSSASHGGVSDSRTARPSTKDQVWHSKSERVSLLVPTAKNPPCMKTCLRQAVTHCAVRTTQGNQRGSRSVGFQSPKGRHRRRKISSIRHLRGTC